ncbi:MAG TPA: PEGA domain-containing protein [Bdellovibrionales bacterium]|nr:PEGA domain-containing protein [Bdellovibrionales bacterium]
MQRGLSIIVLSFLIAACASSTVINTEPQGAQVVIDGQVRGTTPYTYTDRKTIGSTTRVTLKKEGYEDFEALLVRNEEFDAGACAGGVFTLIPFLWVQKYAPERMYELSSLEGTAPEEEDEIDESPEPAATPAPAPPTPAPAAKAGKSVKKFPAPPKGGTKPVKGKKAPKAAARPNAKPAAKAAESEKPEAPGTTAAPAAPQSAPAPVEAPPSGQ